MKKIIGRAMTVHEKRGTACSEVIYSGRLAIDFDKAGPNYQNEPERSVYYEETIVGKTSELAVEGKLAVEIKAKAELTKKELTQSLDYMASHHLEIGPLINFRAKSLQFRRFINEQKLPPKNLMDPISNPQSPRL